MRVDPKGFLIAGKGGRVFVAVKATELRALEKSKNPSLVALGKRVAAAVLEKNAYYADQLERSKRMIEAGREHQAKIDADPKLKAEQEARRREFAKLLESEE